jgi:hypothetical protein
MKKHFIIFIFLISACSTASSSNPVNILIAGQSNAILLGPALDEIKPPEYVITTTAMGKTPIDCWQTIGACFLNSTALFGKVDFDFIVFWQGESDNGESVETYHDKLKALNESWRQIWPHAIFIIIGLEEVSDSPTNNGFDNIRAAQREVAQEEPNTKFFDLKDFSDGQIHDTRKPEIASALLTMMTP